jgi:hypothetical protein
MHLITYIHEQVQGIHKRMVRFQCILYEYRTIILCILCIKLLRVSASGCHHQGVIENNWRVGLVVLCSE